MPASGKGLPPPSGAGGMPEGLPGGMPWGSKRPERSKLKVWWEAAELASEAARAEGASTSSEPSRRRADGLVLQPDFVMFMVAEWFAAGSGRRERGLDA